MGGQYEPHFDFSRVRPTSPVLWKRLKRLELLEALQHAHQAPQPYQSQLFVTGEAQIQIHRAYRAQWSLAVRPVMWGVSFPPNPVVLCLNFEAEDLTRSLWKQFLPSLPCALPGFTGSLGPWSRLMYGTHMYYLPWQFWSQSCGWWVKSVANLGESCCLLQRPFDSGLKTEGNRLATFLNYVSIWFRPACSLSLNFIERWARCFQAFRDGESCGHVLKLREYDVCGVWA